MKKVNSLKSMSQINGRAWSPARSPVQSSFSRSKSTSSMPALVEVDRVKNAKLENTVVHVSETHIGMFGSFSGSYRNAEMVYIVSSFKPVPDHQEWHTGPYGMEHPSDYSLYVRVTDVTFQTKSDGNTEGGTDNSKAEAGEGGKAAGDR